MPCGDWQWWMPGGRAAELAPSFQWDASTVQAGHGAPCASRQEAGTRVVAPATTPSASGELVTSTQVHQHSHGCPGTATITPAQPPPPHLRAHHRGSPAVAAPLARPAAGRRLLRLHGSAGRTRLHRGRAPCTQQGTPTGFPKARARPCPRQCPWPHRAHGFPQGRKGSLPPGQQTGPVGARGRCLAWALGPNPGPGTGDTSPTEMLVWG